MSVLANLARMTTATTGTGTITLGSASTGYLTFAQAGVTDGQVVSYGIVDGNNREVGTGTYTSSGTTLTRTVVNSTNSNSAINLSGSAEVSVTPIAADFLLSLLATATPSGTNVVTFNSIDQSFTHLEVELLTRSTTSGTGTEGVLMTFNNDTTSGNYLRQFGFANASSATALQNAAVGLAAGEAPKAGDVSNYAGYALVRIPFYTLTTFNKLAIAHYATFNNSTTASLFDITESGLWASTAAVTRLDFTIVGNYVSGSQIKLYGRK